MEIEIERINLEEIKDKLKEINERLDKLLEKKNGNRLITPVSLEFSDQ